MKWACAPLLLLLGGTAALAETYDDATCGAIAEYAMDLAYDQGAPMALTPEGRTASTPEGCVLTHVLIEPTGPTGMMVEQITFGGEGLADWVSGQGWPSTLHVRVENAFLWQNMPQFPGMEWSTRVTSRRNAVSGALKLSWDNASGLLALDLLEGGSGRNHVRLSGLVSGIVEGPFQRSMSSIRVHDIDADLSFAGMFETLVLTPLAAGLLAEQEDPEAAFQGFIALLNSYLVALPRPQVDVDSVMNLGTFLDALPSPTGRLRITLKADSGVHVISAVPLVAQMGAPTPENVATLVAELLGPARLSARWSPGPAE